MQHLLQSGLELFYSLLIIGVNIGGVWRAHPCNPQVSHYTPFELSAHWEMCTLLSEASTFKATLPLWRFCCLFPPPHDIFMQMWILVMSVLWIMCTSCWILQSHVSKLPFLGAATFQATLLSSPCIEVRYVIHFYFVSLFVNFHSQIFQNNLFVWCHPDGVNLKIWSFPTIYQWSPTFFVPRTSLPVKMWWVNTKKRTNVVF